MWIIQLDTEREIKETIQNLKTLRSFQNKQKVVCFLIRNSFRDLNEQETAQLEFLNIEYKQVIDLSNTKLNNQKKKAEIAETSQFLFNLIKKNYNNTFKQEDYFKLICRVKNCAQDQINQIKQTQDLFIEIEQELEQLMQHDDGFYSQNAFPLRSIEWQIKKEKEAYMEIQQNRQNKQSEDKLNQINQKIKDLENSKNFQRPSSILRKFCQLLKKPNYYILYLHLVDKIRKFNEKNTYQLQRDNQKLNEEVQQLRKEKRDFTNQRDKQFDEDLNRQINEKQKLIDEKIEILKQNCVAISKRNIGIEIFWREIISQREYCQQSEIDFDPSKTIKEMISKGEPFEFLDGDSLKIDQKFLEQLISNFKEKGQEKILVLSVLGPQSSGKSTILNKIFGCHFWTSVGRCTKGIYLQLLKVHNKAYFNNLFDYIIILDTEGLQSPNQEDSEFDKKIALFVLSISDIILVNVKGDITREFRSLVEMCIYTVGQMRSFTSSKQITWCFNQNNDVNNHDPFLAQLQSIATNLTKELGNHDNEQIDYNEILGITSQNIKILGFASTEKLWKKNMIEGIFADWRQLIINETFSQEAYEYGINMIQAYVNKFGEQKEKQKENDKNTYGILEMENLRCFIEKIETTWLSIIRLPDLLEFSELLQHQQNQSMRKMFNQIINNFVFPTKLDFIKQIHEKIQQDDQIMSIESLNGILKKCNKIMTDEFIRIQNDFLLELQAFRNKNKISKKIFTKYEKMVNDRVNSEKSAIELAIYSERMIQETNFQQKMGFTKIEQFILELLGNENELKKYKEDEGKIQEKFEELWNAIIEQDKQKQEEIFRGHCDELLRVLQENFKECILDQRNEANYKQQYISSLIQQKPQQEDYLKSLEILKLDLSKFQFIIAENKTLNKDYQIFFENFNQSIEKKIMKCSSTQVLQINKFYSQKIEIRYIIKEEFEQYKSRDMHFDIESYCRQATRLDKFEFITFLKNFSIFGYKIQEQKAEILFSYIQRQFQCDQNMLSSCFLSGQRQYFGEAQYDSSIDIINRKCNRFRNYTKVSEPTYNNEIENSKKKFNENNFFIVQTKVLVIVNQNIESQFNTEEVNILSFILNQNLYSQFQGNFRQGVARFIEYLMSDKNNEGWKKIYNEIHQMIQLGKLNALILINHYTSTILHQIKEMKAKQYSFSLIKSILQKIEGKIKDLNMQFSNFGVILSDLGERYIFYFVIFSIWRVLCFKQFKLTKKTLQQLKNQKNQQYEKFKADIQYRKIKKIFNQQIIKIFYSNLIIILEVI